MSEMFINVATPFMYILSLVIYNRYLMRFDYREFKVYKVVLGILIPDLIILMCAVKGMSGIPQFVLIYGGFFFVELLAFDIPLKMSIVYFVQWYVVREMIELNFSDFIYMVWRVKSGAGIYSSIFFILIIVIFYALLGRKFRKTDLRIPDRLQGPMLMLQISLLLNSSVSFSIARYALRKEEFAHFYVNLGGIAIVIVFYVILYIININEGQRYQITALEQLSEQQKAYYKLLLSKEEQTRKYRHDIANNLLQLKFYTEQKEYDVVGEKLNSMIEDIEAIRHSNFSIGIEIVDVIINYYLSPIKDSARIVIEAKGGKISNLNVSEWDVCLVIANLVKNAVEAVSYLPVEHRYIMIKSTVGRQNMSFEISNSYDVLMDGKIDEGTSKDDKSNHGFGINTIKEIVYRNGGQYSCFKKDGIYTAKVLFTIH